MKRLICITLAFLMVLLCLAGCGGSAAADEGYVKTESSSFEQTPQEAADSLTSSTELTETSAENRKLIKTVYLNAETETYDTLLAGLNQRITELGGYVESRETESYRSRYCSITIRIPAEHLDQLVAHVNANANVTSSSENTQDVTLEYVDTEAKITALETEQARLLELLTEAESLADILEIEARLSDVTYELERYASQLRTLANQVSYSTVYLNISEVETLTPTEEPTVWQRISTGFVATLIDLGETLTDVFVWFVVESPNLLVTFLLIFAAYNIFRFFGKRRKNKKQPPVPPAEPPRK